MAEVAGSRRLADLGPVRIRGSWDSWLWSLGFFRNKESVVISFTWFWGIGDAGCRIAVFGDSAQDQEFSA